ncbi:MAG: dephospho-CoA kinase [Magnetococcales bacterium]|nr:dephospho-CoA kinase [Magnetococcales bacterium]
MLVLGLTGAMGCGKSTVAAMMVELGGKLLDSDALARQALAPGSPGLVRTVDLFGPEILTVAGHLDRRRLGAALGTDPVRWRRLEAVVHPEVRRLQARFLEDWSRSGQPRTLVILDEPLLLETDGAGLCDRVVVVVCGQRQMTRLEARGTMDPAVRKAAMDRQLPEREKCRRADEVIDNSRGLDDTRLQVQSLWTRLACQLGRLEQSTWPRCWGPYRPFG